MALLAYCIADTAQINQAEPSLAGIGGTKGAAIRLLTEAGLACLVSDWAPEKMSPGGQGHTAAQSAAELERAALIFHRVVQAIFSRTTVIPFRFPTVLAAESDVLGLLREKAAEYRGALVRLQGRAQIDVRISLQNSSSAARPGGVSDTAQKPSGAEYLRGKQADQKLLAAAAESLRQAGRMWIEDWRERPQPDGLRCFALAERAAMPELARALEAVQIPGAVLARVTGPWPASEFISERPAEAAVLPGRGGE